MQRISVRTPVGRCVGELAPGEAAEEVVAAMADAPASLLEGRAELLTHAHLLGQQHTPAARAQVNERLQRLRRDALKRYVLACSTAAGPRILKMAAGHGPPLLGALRASQGRREHVYHMRATALDLALTESRGWTELWHAGRLVRSCQVQTVLPATAVSLERHLAQSLGRAGEDAVRELAQAVARVHARGFFHADFKAFHAFVVPRGLTPEYDLRFIDLGRVSFTVTLRRRVINLYQILRFVLPDDVSLHERFVRAYCAASGWHAERPERAVARVRAFLEHKLRTHPEPDL